MDKLSYQARGPFIITKVLGGNSFEVQRYGEPNSAPRKYKNTELYLLPLALLPYKVLDTIDELYLDYKNAPIVSPLLKLMRVELYNDKWLQSSGTWILTRTAHLDLPSSELDAIAFTPFTILTVDDLLVDSGILPTTKTIADPLPPVLDSANLHESIICSNNKLLFIMYTTAGTMVQRWFLIQIDLESYASFHSDYAIRSLYVLSSWQSTPLIVG